MIMDEKYTVILRGWENETLDEFPQPDKNEAIKHALLEARKRPDRNVYISFYRNGCRYLNPDGSDDEFGDPWGKSMDKENECHYDE